MGVHIDVERFARIALVGDTVESRDQHARLKQVRVGGAVHEPKLETPAVRHANQMGTVVARIANRIR